MNQIQSQNIQFIKVGYLRAREIEPCKKCGDIQWKLTEKGVDVGLAVRIITEALQQDIEIVVISADTDLIPAFKAVQKMSRRIIHVGYENRPIASLSQSSNATRIITLPLAQKYLSKKIVHANQQTHSYFFNMNDLLIYDIRTKSKISPHYRDEILGSLLRAHPGHFFVFGSCLFYQRKGYPNCAPALFYILHYFYNLC